MTNSLQAVLAGIRHASRTLDSIEAFPRDSLRALAAAGRLGGAIPAEFGGAPESPRATLDGYVSLAEACLTTAFVLSQRDAACHRIALSRKTTLKQELFPRLARGELFATVGISHLSTSRQHCREPAVRTSVLPEGFLLTGSIPWVTGARHADELVVGGTLDDGRQILALVSRTAGGVSVGPSLPLMALRGSQTAAVELESVAVPLDRVLAGPMDAVMKQGPAGTGSLTTSALALGSAGRSLAGLREEASRRPDLAPVVEALSAERARLLEEMANAAEGGALAPAVVERARERANSLVLRAAQAWLAACKGAGFVTGHPAERAVREAMFFLVWSCPQPVVSAALREFACLI